MLYQRFGYQQCDGANVELFYEKIALYGYSPEDAFAHVAYQLYFEWISKLGDWEDIKHRTLQALESEDYGTIKVIMKRRCTLRGFLARAAFNLTARLWPVNWRSV